MATFYSVEEGVEIQCNEEKYVCFRCWDPTASALVTFSWSSGLRVMRRSLHDMKADLIRSSTSAAIFSWNDILYYYPIQLLAAIFSSPSEEKDQSNFADENSEILSTPDQGVVNVGLEEKDNLTRLRLMAEDDDVSYQEFVCMISHRVPQEPVRLKAATTFQVYERSALIQYFATSKIRTDPATTQVVSGLDDYKDASIDVYHWVEANLDRRVAQKWMKQYLMKHLSPRQIGECLMEIVREIHPSWILISNGTSRKVIFDSNPKNMKVSDDFLKELKSKQGVLWAEECHDPRGPWCPSNISVCVNDTLDYNLVSAIKSVWRKSPFYLKRLVVFEMLDSMIPKALRTDSHYMVARRWWKEHEAKLEEFLCKYPQVQSVFVDLALRQNQYLRRLALIVLVPVKGYIPISETELPEQFEGLRIDVQSGVCSPLMLHAHSGSRLPFEPKSYIGQSIGDSKNAGTIGAIVNRGGNIFALTNNHVVIDSRSQCEIDLLAPAKMDTLPGISELQYRRLVVADRTRINQVVNGTFVDAALVKCIGVVQSEKKAGKRETHQIDHQGNCLDCFAPNTAKLLPLPLFFEMTTPPTYFQSSNVVTVESLESPNSYAFTYFGRTSGPADVEFVASMQAMVNGRALIQNLNQDEVFFPKQLVFTTQTLQDRHGDSGSVIWLRSPDRRLVGVGLLWEQAAEFKGMSKYLYASPLDVVLGALDCQLVSHPSLLSTPVVSTSPAPAAARYV